MLIETWSREREQTNNEAADSGIVEKGESSESEDDNTAQVPDTAMGDRAFSKSIEKAN